VKLYEYMIMRNGVGKNGGIKSSLSSKEFQLLGINNSKGWARKNKNLEISDTLLKQLLVFANNNKIQNSKSLQRLQTNFSSADNKFLYLMYNDTNKIHKIGISVDPQKRSRALSSSSGLRVTLKAMWKVDLYARDVERSLHHSLKDFRTLGEWFDLTSIETVVPLVESLIPCQFKRIV